MIRVLIMYGLPVDKKQSTGVIHWSDQNDSIIYVINKHCTFLYCPFRLDLVWRLKVHWCPPQSYLILPSVPNRQTLYSHGWDASTIELYAVVLWFSGACYRIVWSAGSSWCGGWQAVRGSFEAPVSWSEKTGPTWQPWVLQRQGRGQMRSSANQMFGVVWHDLTGLTVYPLKGCRGMGSGVERKTACQIWYGVGDEDQGFKRKKQCVLYCSSVFL